MAEGRVLLEVLCPDCEGDGTLPLIVERREHYVRAAWVSCLTCDGTGKVINA